MRQKLLGMFMLCGAVFCLNELSLAAGTELWSAPLPAQAGLQNFTLSCFMLNFDAAPVSGTLTIYTSAQKGNPNPPPILVVSEGFGPLLRGQVTGATKECDNCAESYCTVKLNENTDNVRGQFSINNIIDASPFPFLTVPLTKK